MIRIKLVKNPEVARLCIAFAVMMAVFTAFTLALHLLAARHFQGTIAAQHAAVVGAILDSYPDAEEDIIGQILQADPSAVARGEAALSRYGIYPGEIPGGTDLLRHFFHTSLVLYLLPVILLGGTAALLVHRFLKRQYSQIHAVTGYTRQIINGNYSLDIRDNNEGELSLLKNEIYKITTRLRERAETLRSDKLALAGSLADISHQLKTPLTAMFVLSDLMQDHPEVAVRAEFLDRMKAQLKRIEWLVNSLLTLSKFDAGTIEMKKEPVEAGLLVDRALDAVAIPLEIKMLQLSVSGEPGTAFSGDFNWTCEALINILKNCIKHTPERGRIEISYTANPLYTEIVIADNGPGIDQADLPYIFNRFYKGKNAGDDSAGIGLAMAQAFVSRQGGDIAVQSEKGRGAAFTIRFFKGMAADPGTAGQGVD